MAQEPVYYWDYLRLDQLLDCQRPVAGRSAHDEMLFIVVHQAFELWFKQILFELDGVLEAMGGPVVPDKQIGQVVAALARVTTIQRTLQDQLDVLETMTPLDFLDFRDLLAPASGFQSVQFRLIENRLGLDPRHRLKIRGAAYTSVLRPDHLRLLEESERTPSLFDHVDRWLARTPFLHLGAYDFWREYRSRAPEGFDELFDPDRYARRLSREAFLAALLISLYRDEPIFQLPFRLLTTLIDLDEGFAAWRYRHSLLAHRMIGSKAGTGGSSGHEYLAATASRHRIFADLFDLPTFFLPRSALPALPDEVTEQMGFRYRAPRPPSIEQDPR
jgi:tryptophan 2,3-dioxygenase